MNVAAWFLHTNYDVYGSCPKLYEYKWKASADTSHESKDNAAQGLLETCLNWAGLPRLLIVGELWALCGTSGRQQIIQDRAFIVEIQNSMLIKWGVVYNNCNDANKWHSNCKSNFANLWRQTSFTVSAKIIFVHAQKISVAAKSIQLLFSTLSLIPLHSLHWLSFSVFSHPVSNQLLESDQNVGWLYGSPARNEQISVLFMSLLLSRRLNFLFFSPYNGSTMMNKDNIDHCAV